MDTTTNQPAPSPRLFHTILLNVYFCVGYFLLAKFGFAWGALTANSTLLWPPSGLALFALLVFGNRVIPGLLIGATAASQFLSLSSALGNTPLSFSVAIFNGSSSVLQAFLIACWSRTWYQQGFRTAPYSAIYFSLLVLLGCTVAATLSNLSMWFVRLMSFSESIQSWMVWWLGDSIGMLVITPLLLWLHQRKTAERNNQANAFLISCAGIGITLFTVTAVGHNEREAYKKNLNYQTVAIQALLQNDWHFLRDDIETLRHYFLTRELTDDDVKILAESIIQHNHLLDNLDWISLAPSTNTQPTKSADEFAQGFRLTRKANGEILLQDFSNETLTEAHANALPLSQNTLQFHLQWRTLSNREGADKKIPIVIISVPIAGCKPTNTNRVDCADSKLLQLTANLDLWMQHSFDKAQQPPLMIQLYIGSDTGQSTWIQWHTDRWSVIAPEDHDQFLSHKDLSLEILDSHWPLHLTAAHPSLAYLPSVLQWSLLLIGFSLTATLGAYLHTLNKHNQLVKQHGDSLESEILAQTEALHAANDWLMKEIEERKEAQEQLKSSENHLRTLLDNIPDPIWFKTVEGQYVSANKAVEVLFDYDKNKILGKTAKDFATTELTKELEEFESQVLNSKTALRKSLWMYMGYYNELRLMDTIKVALRNDQDEPLGILSIARDVTEQKQVESALQFAKETAEEATHAKSRFLANMSHEIRTPLNAVLGYTQLLIADSQLTQLQRERLNAILSSGQRLLSLINSILDLSKIEAGALHLRSDYFDLYQEMVDSITLMKEKAAAKHLALNARIDLPSPAIVKGDRQKIGQIILNLLGNAIKFTVTGTVSFEVSQEQHHILFTVTDTGPGISAHELHSLFSAFKQGKAGQETGGTGLGLVISKHLAEHMGGDLKLISDEGKGTRATLRLPLTLEYAQVDDQHTHHTAIRIAPEKQCRVLVVEDDESSMDILVNLLIDIGCDVTQAKNGAEGLQAALNLQPDMIFTDIRMPMMTGIEMLHLLRQEDTHKALPIIAITASNLEHERSFYLAQGFNDFVGKPYEFSEIYAVLEHFFADRFLAAKASDSEISTDKPLLTQEEMETLFAHLQSLKAAMSVGDMQKTKKIFTLLSETHLGSHAYRHIQQALRQYDLVLAEQWVDEFLATRQSTNPD